MKIGTDGSERRRYKRISLAIPVHYFHNGGKATEAFLLNVSAGGAAIGTNSPPEIGSELVTYIEGLERAKAKVVRHFDGGFAVNFAMSGQKRLLFGQAVARLAKTLEIEAENDRFVGPHDQNDRRNTPREQGTAASIVCRLAHGEVAICRVIDCSISGANLLSEARPELGTQIIMGENRARVVRYTEGGFAVEFVDFFRQCVERMAAKAG